VTAILVDGAILDVMVNVSAELADLDRAVYAAIAATETPTLDRAMRKLAGAADYSRLSMAAAAALAVGGGARGRRAAAGGLAAVAATSAVVNLVIKPVAHRRRPDRAGASVPSARHVPMPASRSFPSGHSAAAMAFAAAASRWVPGAGAPLYALAALVSYSRVHTGVHFPGDVVGGALIGLIVGNLTAAALIAREAPSATPPPSRSRPRP
jgi:membrane-associated phospholipid phosphatase